MAAMTRRTFVGRAAAGAALGWLGTPTATALARGANETIGVAVIGLRGRGQEHLRMIAGTKGLRLVALCDPDPAILAANVRKAEGRGEKVAAFADVRKLLERGDVDAVTIATPNHWHSLAGIWACQAGKDVYVEKPVSHHLWEGRQLVRAARKHACIVQTGTQARANPDVLEALAWLSRGQLGEGPLRPRPVLQPAPVDRQVRPRRHPAGAGLRPLDRPRPVDAAASQTAALRLALALQLRQRRLGQPGHPRNGTWRGGSSGTGRSRRG